MSVENNPATIFETWNQICEAKPEQMAAVGGVVKWRVEGENGGTWMFRGKTEPRVWQADEPADCEIQVSADNFIQIARGELNPQVAFLNGQVQVGGDMSLVLKLSVVLDELIARA